MESARLNKAVSDEGLRGEYGLKVGKRILSSIGSGSLADDLMLRAMAKAAAGSDARMAGCGLPVITNSGSGNQGITIVLPVLEMAECVKASEESLVRALFLAHAVPIHIKKRIGPLSALCGVIAASIGAGAGMMLLQGAKLNQINQLIQYMLADLSGMICDGAKPSCALKIATCVGAAVRSMLFAFDEEIVPFDDGILSADVEESIANFAELGTRGMGNVDNMLLSVMGETEPLCD
jgi:L-cysteine desulfidase